MSAQDQRPGRVVTVVQVPGQDARLRVEQFEPVDRRPVLQVLQRLVEPVARRVVRRVDLVRGHVGHETREVDDQVEHEVRPGQPLRPRHLLGPGERLADADEHPPQHVFEPVRDVRPGGPGVEDVGQEVADDPLGVGRVGGLVPAVQVGQAEVPALPEGVEVVQAVGRPGGDGEPLVFEFPADDRPERFGVVGRPARVVVVRLEQVVWLVVGHPLRSGSNAGPRCSSGLRLAGNCPGSHRRPGSFRESARPVPAGGTDRRRPRTRGPAAAGGAISAFVSYEYCNPLVLAPRRPAARPEAPVVITRVDCPSCGAVLRSTSPKGFVPSTPVSCPRCKQWFAASRPRRRRRPRPAGPWPTTARRPASGPSPARSTTTMITTTGRGRSPRRARRKRPRRSSRVTSCPRSGRS